MEKDVPAPAKNIVVKPNTRSKSILKNKNSIFGQSNLLLTQNKDVYLDRESKLIEKLKDIDEGKPKGPTNVTNALFIGSTAELSKILKQQYKNEDIQAVQRRVD